MAGSMAINQEYFGRKRSVVCKCTVDASGGMSGIPFEVQGGELYAFAFVPGAGVTAAWDLVLKAKYRKPDGTTIEWADILGGDGANLSESTNGGNKALSTGFGLLNHMVLEPVISNAGNATVIHIVFYMWEEI